MQSWGEPGAFQFLGPCPAECLALPPQSQKYCHSNQVQHPLRAHTMARGVHNEPAQLKIPVHSSAQRSLPDQESPPSTWGDPSPDFFPLLDAQSLSEEETEPFHFDTLLTRDPKGRGCLHSWQLSAAQLAAATVPHPSC